MGAGKSEDNGGRKMIVRRFRVRGATIDEAIVQISKKAEWLRCSVRLCQPEWWEVTVVIEE